MWQLILTAMLFLQAPGKSIYSMVPTTEDGTFAVLAETNGTTAYVLLPDGADEPNQCRQQGNIACYKPRHRDVIYNGFNIRTEWMRAETYNEGVKRYAVIAHAIDDVMEEGEWKFPAGQLWRYLLAIAYHESGFRRDIHTGIGSAALGDCKWRKLKNGKREMVKGTCRSHGLFQSLFRKPRQTKLFGFGARDIIGDDLETTKLAVLVATKHLDRLYRFCTHHGPRPFTGCIFASYGGMSDTRDKRIQSRVASFNRLKGAPTKLDEYAKNLLGLSGTSKVAAASLER